MMIDLEDFRERFNRNDRFSASCGMKLSELAEGYAKVELDLGEEGKNFMGSAHGGLLYTMADVAAGSAAVSVGKQIVTLSAAMEYIRPVFSGRVVAEGRVIAQGKTVSRCEVEVRDGDGLLVAKSYITMFITDKELAW